MNTTTVPSRSAAALALVLLVPAATLGTWSYFFAGEQQPWGMAAYYAAKVWLLGLPVVWLLLMDRQRPRLPRWSSSGMTAAVVTGSAILAIILLAYYFLGRRWIDDPQAVAETITQRLGTPLLFWGFGGFIILINSLIEEYVWRWFVTTRCQALLRRPWPAVLLAGACFTAHHVVALAAYFDWRITVLGSIGVFVGGVTWSWLYARYRNIYAAYISHVFADIAIFIVGHDIVFGW